MERQQSMRHSLFLVCGMALGLAATFAYAQSSDALCQSLSKEIDQAQEAQQYLQQLQKIAIAVEQRCLGDDGYSKAKKMKQMILRRWSTQILDEVIPVGEKARFDREQWVRLQRYHDDIAAMQPYIANMKTDWLAALLSTIVEPPETVPQFSQVLQPIFDGYITDMKNHTLPEAAIRSDLGEFISQLDQGLNLKNTTEQTFTSRAFGEPPQVTMIKSRGANFASSINTPIRFEYNSTKLSQRGKQEYKTILSLLASNTTKSIFLIGHASPEGSAAANCALSKRRVQALKDKIVRETTIPESRISIAWAGENIPLNFGQANEFLRNINLDSTGLNNEARRRVEIELNGELLRQRYAAQLCE